MSYIYEIFKIYLPTPTINNITLGKKRLAIWFLILMESQQTNAQYLVQTVFAKYTYYIKHSQPWPAYKWSKIYSLIADNKLVCRAFLEQPVLKTDQPKDSLWEPQVIKAWFSSQNLNLQPHPGHTKPHTQLTNLQNYRLCVATHHDYLVEVYLKCYCIKTLHSQTCPNPVPL